MATASLHTLDMSANRIKLDATTALDEISTRAEGLAALVDMASCGDDLDDATRAALRLIADYVRGIHGLAFAEARQLDHA